MCVLLFDSEMCERGLVICRVRILSSRLASMWLKMVFRFLFRVRFRKVSSGCFCCFFC